MGPVVLIQARLSIQTNAPLTAKHSQTTKWAIIVHNPFLANHSFSNKGKNQHMLKKYIFTVNEDLMKGIKWIQNQEI